MPRRIASCHCAYDALEGQGRAESLVGTHPQVAGLALTVSLLFLIVLPLCGLDYILEEFFRAGVEASVRISDRT